MIDLDSPLLFEPLFQERMWGGRKLGELFGKNLPRHGRIGESWEIVDREEAQSVVRDGPLRGTMLHELWTTHRKDVFGHLPDAERFPLLVKLLDAQQKLSLQVHPPQSVAKQLGSEAKTEFWYVAAADPNAQVFVGLCKVMKREEFQEALEAGTITEHVHTISVKPGDAMFLPAGRFHAVGAGNVLVEVQQNSDTTYRVFDWNRLDEHGKPRALHIDQALASIDFNDVEPTLIEPDGELLVRHELFEVQKWDLDSAREIIPHGQFAIVFCLSGKVRCGGAAFKPGEFFLVPAQMRIREVVPLESDASLLRVTIPL